jgi:CBS domain-containing protein
MRGAREHENMTAGQLAAPILSAAPDDSLLVLGEKLWSVDWGEIPVVDPADPSRPIGIVTRRALLGAFDRELLQREVLMTRVVWFDGQREAVDFLELPDGHRVEIVTPPASIVGEPADGAVLRQRFGVTLVALRRDEGGDAQPGWRDPDAAQRIEANDRLMIIATLAEVERLRASP